MKLDPVQKTYYFDDEVSSLLQNFSFSDRYFERYKCASYGDGDLVHDVERSAAPIPIRLGTRAFVQRALDFEGFSHVAIFNKTRGDWERFFVRSATFDQAEWRQDRRAEAAAMSAERAAELLDFRKTGVTRFDDTPEKVRSLMLNAMKVTAEL